MQIMAPRHLLQGPHTLHRRGWSPTAPSRCSSETRTPWKCFGVFKVWPFPLREPVQGKAGCEGRVSSDPRRGSPHRGLLAMPAGLASLYARMGWGQLPEKVTKGCFTQRIWFFSSWQLGNQSWRRCEDTVGLSTSCAGRGLCSCLAATALPARRRGRGQMRQRGGSPCSHHKLLKHRV